MLSFIKYERGDNIIKKYFLIVLFYLIYIFFTTYKNEEIKYIKIHYNNKTSKIININGKKVLKNKNYEFYPNKPGFYTIYFDRGKVIKVKESYTNNLSLNLKKIFKTRNETINKYFNVLVLNEKHLLTKSEIKKYKHISVSHLLAISGLHLSILCKILDVLLSLIKYRFKYIVNILIIIFYTAIIGFTPSITRAGFMYIIYYFSKIFNFNISTYKKLLLSFIITISINPFNIWDISYILSYLCILAIILSENENIFIKNIYIQLLICPILFIYFKNFNFLTFIFNVYIIFLFEILFVLILITSILKFSFLINLTIEYLYNFNLIIKISNEIYKYFPSNIYINIIIYFIFLIAIIIRKKSQALQKKI